jgi:hypothetical protein
LEAIITFHPLGLTKIGKKFLGCLSRAKLGYIAAAICWQILIFIGKVG